MQAEMLWFYSGAVAIVAVGLGLEVWGRNKLKRRRRADMIAAALREEELRATDNAILREKLEDEAILHGRGPVDYFEVGRKLAVGPTCLACENGDHGIPKGHAGCRCPCHQDEKVSV